MALPVGGQMQWPPRSEASAYVRYGEWSAWYSGSAAELERFYAGYAGQDRTGFFDPKTTAQPFTSIWRRFAFWARQDPGAIQRGRLHVPIAADISSTSSDLLFSDFPDVVVPEAHVAKAKSGPKKAQDELNDALEDDNIPSTLTQGAEISSSLGGAFLRVLWDRDFVDHPMLNVVHPDAAVPEFRYDRLSAVTFWRVVHEDSKAVLRHLERHERGFILNGLYRGDRNNLGNLVSLDTVPETTGLSDTYATGLEDLTAVYIPNLLPNRSDRRSPLGRSDYAGAEGLMDSLDETMTSWMREFRLGKARLIVPPEYLLSLGKGKGAQFDLDREVYETVNMQPNATAPIQAHQFQIRVNEHLATAENLLERIVAASGYSAGTFGLASRQAQSTEKTATEVKAREHRSLTTRGKKQQYWQQGVSQILYVWLAINANVFGGPAPYRARLDFPDVVHESTIDMANSVALLRGAKTLSLKTAILMAHPDWDPDEVQSEVDDIQNEAQPVIKAVSSPAVSGSPNNPQNQPPTSNVPGQPAAPPTQIADANPQQPSGGVPPPATGLGTANP